MKTKLYVEHNLEEGMKDPGHMTKMAINSIKIFFSRTRRPMILKLGMKHQEMEHHRVCINHDPGMTLTFFTARSTSVAHAFEWVKIGNLTPKNLLGMSKWTEDLCL